MKQLLLASAALLGLTSGAYAVPIAAGSVLNVIGSANFTATNVLTSTPAALTTNTGSFSPLTACLTCVTVNIPNFVYAPAVQTGKLFTVDEVVLGVPLEATITLLAGGTSQHPVTNALAIEAPASLTMTGFDTTPGQFVWTINQFGALAGSFSATAQASAVPEPASIAVLGAGVLGLGMVAARRRRS
jgi:hypothetical protein